eukprot:scaffold12328_cov86-Cylindrotheca_fusiformis.AAC.4
MGVFGKKKKKNGGKPLIVSEAPAATRKKPQGQPSKQVIKIVGDEKHITTERIDAQGRTVKQTRVEKLTDAERQQFGGGGQSAEPAARKSPPRQRQQQQQQQQYQQEQYQPSTPPSTAKKVKKPPQSSTRNTSYGSTSTSSSFMKQPTPMDNSSTGAGSANGGGGGVPQQQQQQVTTLPFGDESLATIEITRELVKQFISAIWNRGEVELIPDVCHPSLRFNGQVGMDRVGHDGFTRMVTTVREALTDYHCEIHSMVVESNKAFCRLRFSGKHTGNLLGYPPTGKTVSWMGASEFTCKNGKILKVWELGDVKSLEDQLRSSD